MALADQAEARVIAATVIGNLEGDAYSPIRYSPEATARHESVVGMLRDDLRALVDAPRPGSTPVDVVVPRGRTVPTIVRLAETENVDLIVMGTHGRTGLKHFMVGSTTEELVRTAPCSVLTLDGDEERRPADIQRLLVPVDLSSFSPGLLDYAISLARGLGAAVDILHVVEPVPLLDIFSGAMTIGDIAPTVRKKSANEIEKLLRQVDTDGMSIGIQIKEGHAASEILAFAEENASDLILIGAHGRSALERFFIGSVAERVVRTASCPVLAARLAVERV